MGNSVKKHINLVGSSGKALASKRRKKDGRKSKSRKAKVSQSSIRSRGASRSTK